MGSDRITNPKTQNASEERNELRMFSGMQAHYTCNTSGGGTITIPVANKNCRYVEVDVSGLIRLTYQDDHQNSRTITRYVSQGEIFRAQNVVSVDGDTTTAQVYPDAGGSATAGIRLIF